MGRQRPDAGEVESMRVYIDQNHWISLARAAVGHEMGNAYLPVLEALERAVAADLVEVPLSAIHMFEVAGTALERRRRDVVDRMLALSGGRFLLPFTSVYPAEVENAVRRSLGEDEIEIAPSLTSHGVAHALGQRPVITGVPPNLVAALHDAIASVDATRLFMVLDKGDEYRASSRASEEGAATEINAIRTRARAAGASRQELLEHNQRDFMRNQYVPLLLQCMEERQIPANDWERRLAPPKPGELEVMMSCPSIDAWLALEVWRDFDWDRAVTGNDFRDQAFLSVAVPYCDIVVTERYFGGLLQRSGLAERQGVQVITRLEDLPTLLPRT